MSAKAKEPRRTSIPQDLIDSLAFRELSGVATKVLIYFMAKRHFKNFGTAKKQRWVLENGRSICFTYKEALNKYGISQKRFTRAIDDLLEKGFISIVHPGGTCEKDKAAYAIEENWRFWVKGKVCFERKHEPVQRGFCKPKREPRGR